MKFNNRRPSPALVIAVVALFAALGGTAYAAAAINGSQLVNGSVAGKKLKNHTITGKQVNLSQLGKVPTAARADNATTAGTATSVSGSVPGSQITGAVANATNAGTAASVSGNVSGSQITGAVATATNAASATNVGGFTFARINATNATATFQTVLSDFGGLTLQMNCSGGHVNVEATSATAGASYNMSGVANANATNDVDAEGTLSTTPLNDQTANPAQLTFSYEGASSVVSGTIGVYDDAGTCSAFGNAEDS